MLAALSSGTRVLQFRLQRAAFLEVLSPYWFSRSLGLHFSYSGLQALAAGERKAMGNNDSTSKTPGNGASKNAKKVQAERRSTRRCKINQLMRLCPSDPGKPYFDDIRGTVSVSRDGVYFHTSEPGYELGMRLFVTMPYAKPGESARRDYLAEVVRKSALSNGLTGIGIKILTELGQSLGYQFVPPENRS